MPTTRLLAAGLTAAAALAVAVPTFAASAGPRIDDLDADIVGGKVRLEAEANGATRLTFTYAGRTYAGRVTDTDDDGDRDFSRTVTKAKSHKVGTVITLKARACDADRCVTKTSRERLEREDD